MTTRTRQPSSALGSWFGPGPWGRNTVLRTELHNHNNNNNNVCRGCPRRVVKGSGCHDEGVSGKQEQESVAEHAEGGVIRIPEYCPDF